MARNKVRNSTGDSAWANSLSTVYKRPTRAGQKHLLAVCRQYHNVHHRKRHMPALDQRLTCHTLILFFKIKTHLSPSYLSEILPQSFTRTTEYNLRGNNYPVPYLRRKKSYASFFPRAIVQWNNLPSDIQQSCSLGTFRQKLKFHLNF